MLYLQTQPTIKLQLSFNKIYLFYSGQLRWNLLFNVLLWTLLPLPLWLPLVDRHFGTHISVFVIPGVQVRKFKFKLQIKFIFLWEFLVRVRLVLHRRDRDGTEVRRHPLQEQEGRLCQEDGPANGDLKFEFLSLFLVKFVCQNS